MNKVVVEGVALSAGTLLLMGEICGTIKGNCGVIGTYEVVGNYEVAGTQGPVGTWKLASICELERGSDAISTNINNKGHVKYAFLTVVK